ncbi:DUF116 domain-containing protein [Actinomycetota bacterium]
MVVESKLTEESKVNEELFKSIKPDQRVLLVSHCMRSSEKCTAKMTRAGLGCRDDCSNRCSIGRLRILAEKQGYKGICIAPGGSMALKFIKEKNPKGIVAIACMKELAEGVDAVKELEGNGKNNGSVSNDPIVISVPLLKDGCIDTEVDEEEAERIIEL